jgi:hypothetical protein
LLDSSVQRSYDVSEQTEADGKNALNISKGDGNDSGAGTVEPSILKIADPR